MVLKYRMNTLGWYNFETLIKTLLKQIIGSGVTSYGGTKDGGRDAIFNGEAPFPSENTRWRGDWIFQIKFSEIEKITKNNEGKRYLKEIEQEILSIKKRHKNWPNNYIIITSFRVSTSIRDELSKLILKLGFKGNFHSVDGREVCEFLDIYPQIRRSFPQLLGITDIQQIINADLYNRSKAFIDYWQPQMAAFVCVNQYFKALNLLNKFNFILLDGPPEVGKSFIGVAITLVYVCENFQIFFIREPNDIFKVYKSHKSQIFFADDAIGSIDFDPRLGDYWSRDIPAILEKLDNKHKLIWTARSYILQEALLSTKFQEILNDFPESYEVIVKVDDFSLIEKGMILYNHVKNSSLPVYVRNFIKEIYNDICSNPNFTALRIRQLVQDILLKILKEDINTEKGKKTKLKQIKDFLKSPSDNFLRAYKTLGKFERLFLILLLNLGPDTAIEKLREEYERRISDI